MFSNYDVFALHNTAILQKFQWDPYLPLYYTDVDFYYRLRLAGVELIETNLPVQHLEGGSTTLHANPALHTFVQTNYPAWRQYYLQKWGGERDQEIFTTPFNQIVPPIRNGEIQIDTSRSGQSIVAPIEDVSAQRDTSKGSLRSSPLDPLFHELHSVDSAREMEAQHRAWRLPECDYPISLTNEEGGILYEMILQNGLKNGFEVATGFGMSSFWAGLALRETGGRLISMDSYIEEQSGSWNYTPHQAAQVVRHEEPRGLRFAKRAATQLGLLPCVSYAVGVSPEDVPSMLAGQTIDYAFIDRLHYSGQPLRDFMALAPYLAPRCLVAFHSNQENCSVPEAIRAAEDYLAASALVCPTRHRLTLVGRGMIATPNKNAVKRKIVIATHNGASVLPALLDRLDHYGAGDQELLIVDTGSDDPASLEYLARLTERGIPVTQTPYRGYDTGAYLWAFRHHPADNYLFMQDSLLVTAPDWLERFSTDSDVTALAAFPFAYDNAAQRNWLIHQFPSAQMKTPTHGIFGPVFATSHAVLIELDQCGFLAAVPSDKNQQQAMERGWAIAFASRGIKVRFLVENYVSLNVSDVGVQKQLFKRP